MSTCVMFGEYCFAICLLIGYWNQVGLGVLKSINGVSSDGPDHATDRWYFAWIDVVLASLNLSMIRREDPNWCRWYVWWRFLIFIDISTNDNIKSMILSIYILDQ